MILHVDMDAFFASVEQSCDPRLRGIPIAVAGEGKRSIITTASYEARRFGVKTGMPVHQGILHCPHLKVVIADFQKYSSTSEQIMEIFRHHGAVEVASVDEAFLDIGEQPPEPVARAIKKEIYERFRITCSIGAGSNKTIAKLASGINKPDGFFHARSFADIQDLPVKEVCGIGRKSSRRLALVGIKTIADLVRSEPTARAEMGIWGTRLILALQGVLKEPVNTSDDMPKSVGNSMTLEKDIWHRKEIEKALFQLSEKVGYRLCKKGLHGHVVSITVRYSDFRTFGTGHHYHAATCDEKEIFQRSLELLGTIRLEKSVRLLGVCVSALEPSVQRRLFDKANDVDRLNAVDAIRQRWGYDSVTWGVVAHKYDHKPPISPAWRPERAADS